MSGSRFSRVANGIDGAGRSRRSFLGLVGAVGVAGFVTACSNSDSKASAAGAGELTGEIAVSGLNSIVSAAPFAIASAEFYKAAGVKATNVHISGGTDTVRAITANSVCGSAATISTILAYQAGAKNLRIIAGGFNAPSVVFVGKSGHGIASPKDLRGRKIGIAGAGSPVEFFAELAVKEGGFEPDRDVEVVSVGDYASVWPAVENGLVDLGALVPPQSSQQIVSGNGELAFSSADLMPQWADVVMCTTEKNLEQHKAGLVTWVKSVQQALDLIVKDPEQAAAIWGPTLDLDEEVALSALTSVPAEAWSVEIGEEFIAPAAEAAVDLGLADNADIDGLLDTSILEAL